MTVGLLDSIFLYAAAVNAVVVFITLSYQLYQRHRKASSSSSLSTADNVKEARILNGFALAVPLTTALYTTQRALSRIGIGNCRLHVICAILFWSTTKLMMYLFFIARLDAAFTHSAFKFSRTIFYVLYAIVIFAWLSSNIQYSVWGDSVKMHSPELGLTWCASLSPFWTLLYLGAWDLVICVLLTFMFTKRLLDAFLQKRDMKDTRAVDRVIRTVARYVTLSIVGVSTTITSLLLLAFAGLFTPIAVDMIVNNHCILLMYSANLKYFRCVCGPLHSCIGKCFKLCMPGAYGAADIMYVISMYGMKSVSRLELQTGTTSNPSLSPACSITSNKSESSARGASPGPVSTTDLQVDIHQNAPELSQEETQESGGNMKN